MIIYCTMLNPLAQELNDILRNTTVEALLSDMGIRMYFPKGIIAQSNDAKKAATTANGTIGMTVIHGTPAILPSIQKNVPALKPGELVAYAPTGGIPELRKAWQDKILEKNPLLKNKKNNHRPSSYPV